MTVTDQNIASIDSLSHYQNRQVKEIMTVGPVTFHADTALSRALSLFKESEFHHIPIVDHNNQCIGILSDRDVRTVDVMLAALQENPDGKQFQVGEVMTREPITVGSRDTIARAAELLVAERINALPVVDDRDLVGIITSTDLVKLLVPHKSREPDFPADLKHVIDETKKDGRFFEQPLYLADEIAACEEQFSVTFPEDYKLTVTHGSYEIANFNFVKPYRHAEQNHLLVFAEWNDVLFAFNSADGEDTSVYTLGPKLSPEKSELKNFTEWLGYVYSMSARPVNPE